MGYNMHLVSMGYNRNAHKVLSESLKERDILDDIELDGKKIFKLIQKLCVI
jgi:hypothetical protein